MQEIQPQLLEQYIKILQQENLEYNRNELVRFIYEMTQLNDDDVMKLLDTLKCMHENSIQHRDYVIAQDQKILKENPWAGAQSGSNHYLTRFVDGVHTFVPCKFPPVIRLPEMMSDTRKHYVNSNGAFFNPIGYLDSFVKYYNSVLVIVLLYLEKLIEKLNEMKKQPEIYTIFRCDEMLKEWKKKYDQEFEKKYMIDGKYSDIRFIQVNHIKTVLEHLEL